MSNIACADQPNINFLNNNSFKFNLLNSRLVNFFCIKVNIPQLSINTADQSTLYNRIQYPGDELDYSDLIVTFKVDEDFKNYMEIYSWITKSAHPIDLVSLYEQQIDVKNNKQGFYKGESDNGGIFSDAILTVLDNALNPKYEVKFNNCFPVRLSSIEFDTEVSSATPLQCTASFRYTYYTINKL